LHVNNEAEHGIQNQCHVRL